MRAGRLEPAASIVEMGVCADGAGDDIELFERAIVRFFEASFEDAGEFEPAPLEESGGMDVAVEGGAAGEAVIVDDFTRLAPADEIAFDGVAVGMRTDRAKARVAFDIGRSAVDGVDNRSRSDEG